MGCLGLGLLLVLTCVGMCVRGCVSVVCCVVVFGGLAASSVVCVARCAACFFLLFG